MRESLRWRIWTVYFYFAARPTVVYFGRVLFYFSFPPSPPLFPSRCGRLTCERFRRPRRRAYVRTRPGVFGEPRLIRIILMCVHARVCLYVCACTGPRKTLRHTNRKTRARNRRRNVEFFFHPVRLPTPRIAALHVHPPSIFSHLTLTPTTTDERLWSDVDLPARP